MLHLSGPEEHVTPWARAGLQFYCAGKITPPTLPTPTPHFFGLIQHALFFISACCWIYGWDSWRLCLLLEITGKIPLWKLSEQFFQDLSSQTSWSVCQDSREIVSRKQTNKQTWMADAGWGREEKNEKKKKTQWGKSWSRGHFLFVCLFNSLNTKMIWIDFKI